MSLHLMAQYAILVFATVEWVLAGRPVGPTPDPAEADRPAAPAAQEWTIPGDRLLVTNLVGKVTLGAGSGDRFVVRVRLRGKDAETLQVQVEEGGDAELHVVYPIGEHSRYVYPEMGADSRAQIGTWRPEARSSALREMLEHLSDRKIEVRGRSWSDALEAWADVEILVPPSKPASVKLGVGGIDASSVQASLDLDTKAGSIAASDISGDVVLDTGAGTVSVRGVRGDALIDTGSGEVTTSEVRTSSAEIDTGPGEITLDLAAMGPGRYVIDSGSGQVTVFIPTDASARIQASTGSGGIEVDLPAARVSRLSRNEVSLEVGKGEAQVLIDTGSGGIRISRRP